MRKLFYIFTILLLGVGFYSCIDTEPSSVGSVEGETVTISFAANAGGSNARGFDDSESQNAAGSDEDNAISELRVLVFRTTGSLAYNKYISGSDPNAQYKLELSTGTYDFIFIANETSDAMVHSFLSDFSGSITALLGQSFSSTAFDASRNIPMTHRERNVRILGEGRYKLESGSETTEMWNVGLTRLGIRLDLRIETEVFEKKNNFVSVELANIPDNVPMFATDLAGNTNTNGGSGNYETTARVITLSEGAGGGFSQEGTTYRWQKERIILPSSVFADPTDRGGAVTFKANYTSDIPSDNGVLGPKSTSPNDYTAPRNHYFLYTGTVKATSIEVHLKVDEWKSAGGEWIVPGNNYLNISHTSVNIGLFNGVRVHFSSNLPQVWVSKAGFKGATGWDTTVNTDKVFNELTTDYWNEYSGGPRRFKYYYNNETGIGTGYMDIVSQARDDLVIGDNIHRITLTAGKEYNNGSWAKDEWGNETYYIWPNSIGKGEIQREIKVTTTKLWNHQYYADWASRTQYVATFHRLNQTGERVISNFSNYTTWTDNGWDMTEGSNGWYDHGLRWTAEVVDYDNPGGNWITISGLPSFDANIGTANPGDPEKFQIAPADRQVWIEGSGRTFFRIGLTGTASANRYGKVLVKLFDYDYHQVTSYYIYVRQGENTDYLMRTSDAIPSGTMAGHSRTLAKPIAPFNLTAPGFKTNPATTSQAIKFARKTSDVDNGTAPQYFTDYPSQAGAMFYWLLPSAKDGLRRYAYHPTQPETISSTYWTTDAINEYDGGWDYRVTDGSTSLDNETCPPGYHRPNDGPTNARSGAVITLAALQASEIRQSLFENPPTGDNSVNYPYQDAQYANLNSVWGKIADGFFDRLPAEDWGGSSVSKGNTLAAYAGNLFYNPNNSASVFFPAAGRRNAGYGSETAGQLMYNAGAGYYWTTATGSQDVNILNGGIALYIGNPKYNKVFMGLTSYNYASSVRCMKN